LNQAQTCLAQICLAQICLAQICLAQSLLAQTSKVLDYAEQTCQMQTFPMRT
jgi:hypothetical protein